MNAPREFVERLIALRLMLEPDKPPLPDSVIRSYWQILSEHHSMDAIAKALNGLARTSKWFPKPAEILEQIQGGGPEELAEKAVGELERAMESVGPYESIVFSDRALAAALHSLGGWPTVCNWTESEWPFRVKEFKALYASYVKRGVPRGIPAQLPGIHERSPSGVQVIGGEIIRAGTAPKLWGDKAACMRLLGEGPDRSSEVVAKLMSEAKGELEGEPVAPWEE